MTNNSNQSRTNGPINAHLNIAKVMPKYNSAAKIQKWIGVRFERGLAAYLATRESARWGRKLPMEAPPENFEYLDAIFSILGHCKHAFVAFI